MKKTPIRSNNHQVMRGRKAAKHKTKSEKLRSKYKREYKTGERE